jgi:hypothetical protein
MVQSEERQNGELIGLSRQILDITKAIQELTLAHTGDVGRPPSDSMSCSRPSSSGEMMKGLT